MLSAIILAAGNSSRMGRPKALLEYGGEFFIERVCAALRAAGVAERVVVLGRDAAAITSAWKSSGEKVAVNPEPDLGQMSSVRVGLSAAGPAAEGFMICLADQPTIITETYKEVAAFWVLHKDAIVIPRCLRSKSQVTSNKSHVTNDSTLAYKRGHPIIIPAAHSHLCFEGPLDKGLHWVTHHPSVQVLDLNVEDSGIIRDCDTPEDYNELIKGAELT
jgi:molybdenum cofactor cytidylyltransferase